MNFSSSVDKFFEEGFKAKDEVEIAAKVCDKFSFSTIVEKTKIISASLKSTYKYNENFKFGGELSSKKYYNVQAEISEVVLPGFNILIKKGNKESDDNKEEPGLEVAVDYNNSNFGKLKGKIVFPEAKNSFISLSGNVKRDDLNGFGANGVVEITINDKSCKKAAVHGSYEKDSLGGNLGLEYTENWKLLTGFSYIFGENNHKRFLARVNYDFGESDYSADIGVAKKCENYTWGVKANTDGLISTQFSTTMNSHTVSFGTEVDIWESIGRVGVQFSTSI